MIDFSTTVLEQIVVHKVGNKSRDEGVVFSKSALEADNDITNVLKTYFLSPFKSNELFNLDHDADIHLNPIYSYSTKIFGDNDLFIDQSIAIANHLYDQSGHPKVKEGELYVVLLRDCIINDEQADAVGIFKSESRETFLKVFMKSDNFTVNTHEGISISKLDKGCLIFNTEADRGYVVAVVDSLSKGAEAQFWCNDFLNVKVRNDNFFQTSELIKLCKGFVTEKLPEDFEITKADQADFFNKSVAYFKEKDAFTFDDFKQEVIQQPEIIQAFDNYKNEYENTHEVTFEKEFSIEDGAVKKQARILKSVIKLDKNFHVYVHGGREKIVKGYDAEKELSFYQLFYKDEN